MDASDLLAAPVRQSGVALVVGLLLLGILTLLAVSGVSTAALELRMAGNEQYQERAFQAADAGIEHAIRAGGYDTGSSIGTYLPAPRAGFPPVPQRGTGVRGCVPTIDETASVSDSEDCYEYFLRFDAQAGPTVVPGAAPDGEPGLQAYHFVIDSFGSSGRGAQSHHSQGFYVAGTNPPGSPPSCPADPTGCAARPQSPPVRTYWRHGGS